MTFLILFASYICANKDLYISQKVEPTVAQNDLLEVAEISEEDERLKNAKKDLKVNR